MPRWSEGEEDFGGGEAPGRQIVASDETPEDSESISTESLEAALAEATARWSTASPVEPPGTARLAAFRRRFHEIAAALG